MGLLTFLFCFSKESDHLPPFLRVTYVFVKISNLFQTNSDWYIFNKIVLTYETFVLFCVFCWYSNNRFSSRMIKNTNFMIFLAGMNHFWPRNSHVPHANWMLTQSIDTYYNCWFLLYNNKMSKQGKSFLSWMQFLFF